MKTGINAIGLRLTSNERLEAWIFPILWALLASAMLVESDVYRYVTIALVIFAFWRQPSEVRRVSRDWLAVLCYVWSAYVLVRFAIGITVYGEKGSSEWLYAFPAFFPLVGAALYATRRYLFTAATLLVLAGLVGLLATMDFRAVIEGSLAPPLFHKNPIHAGVGSSMLFITALFWLLYAGETGRLSGRGKWRYVIPACATMALGLLGALGAQSKGAWLALAATLALMGLLALFHIAGKGRIYLFGGLIVVGVSAAVVASPYVLKVAGSTVDAAIELTDGALLTEGPVSAMRSAIEKPSTPEAMRERLMLWSDALELIQASSLVGWGNLWLREWRQTTYSSVGFTLIHNGYLEIMVRHGFLGLTVLAVFALASAWRINRAHREGLISMSLALYLFSISFFFFATIATNSNNRLAIGESFFIFAAAVVFALTLVRKASLAPGDKPRI
ncbi:O-antigen ligase domain-containing protein [Rhizobium sp. S-51]|uniref:O-antigen ligase domain-containing protein n=1 Tax=Rhizobium terricola TaxID=2728849 RepID=A0A7Y0AY98_9HYPH|nr:O-antigen ligase family protein [Rhizobium terricola]NML75708.1 O-antigen ligase domain-containing protein [Rhizobium terricola]